MWVEQGLVDHIISPERQTIGYIIDYYRAQGRLHGARRFSPGKFLVGRVPLGLWTHLARSYIGYQFRRAAGKEWVGALAHYARMRGAVDFYRLGSP